MSGSDSDKSREVLFKAAELIKKKGFEATTVNDISKATGLTKGGLYHYIKSKEDLLYQIMSRAMDTVREEIVEPLRRIDDPQKQLRTFIRLHLEVVSRYPGALTALAEEAEGLTKGHRRNILARKREYFEFVRGILDRLKEQGKLADLDTSVLAFDILGMILFFPRWYKAEGRLQPAEVAEQMAALVFGGLLSRKRE